MDPAEAALVERPRERLLARGASSLSDAELVAIFLGTGASKTEAVAGGTLDHDQARSLVEATSSGALPQAVAGLPAGAQGAARNAAEQGFIHGLNEILVLGALLSFAGAVLALWLVRESDIERETLVDTAFEGEAEPARA